MSVETEVKVSLAAPEEFEAAVLRLGAVLLSARHFEDNAILDFPGGQLRGDRCLLRVRTTDHGAWLTFKGPPQESSLYKIREELEVGVDAASTALRILERLGMEVWFRYQKYRTEYRLLGLGQGVAEILVALDETPIGNYAELEGSEEGILAVARRLGLGESAFLRDSYYSLYVKHCHDCGCAPGHMVFSGGARS